MFKIYVCKVTWTLSLFCIRCTNTGPYLADDTELAIAVLNLIKILFVNNVCVRLYRLIHILK